jgi:hypothetical protein
VRKTVLSAIFPQTAENSFSAIFPHLSAENSFSAFLAIVYGKQFFRYFP